MVAKLQSICMKTLWSGVFVGGWLAKQVGWWGVARLSGKGGWKKVVEVAKKIGGGGG